MIERSGEGAMAEKATEYLSMHTSFEQTFFPNKMVKQQNKLTGDTIPHTTNKPNSTRSINELERVKISETNSAKIQIQQTASDFLH